MRDNFSDSVIMRGKPRKVPASPKVTIAIGFISRPEDNSPGEIILACESQTTYGNSKDYTAEKLNIIKFRNAKVLMANAGFVRESKLAVASIRERAANAVVESPQTVRLVIEEAMRDVRASLCYGKSITDERAFFLNLDHGFDFLIGFYFHQTLYLFHVNISGCTVCPVENENYAAIGCGDELARYLIKEYQKADPRFIHCDQIAVSIIEKVKLHIVGCGGPTRVGHVFPSAIENLHSQASIYPDGTVNLLARELERQEHTIAENRNVLMRQVIENTHRMMEQKIKEGGEITVIFER